jgi:DNA-binding NtrC family response regulator
MPFSQQRQQQQLGRQQQQQQLAAAPRRLPRSRRSAAAAAPRAQAAGAAEAASAEIARRAPKDVRVVVAGPTGYIGKFVTKELISRGYQARAQTATAATPLAGLGRDQRVCSSGARRGPRPDPGPGPAPPSPQR